MLTSRFAAISAALHSRLTRQRAIRLAKAGNNREFKVPLCSFNVEATNLIHRGLLIARPFVAAGVGETGG
jgi:hypothetical protein